MIYNVLVTISLSSAALSMFASTRALHFAGMRWRDVFRRRPPLSSIAPENCFSRPYDPKLDRP